MTLKAYQLQKIIFLIEEQTGISSEWVSLIILPVTCADVLSAVFRWWLPITCLFKLEKFSASAAVFEQHAYIISPWARRNLKWWNTSNRRTCLAVEFILALNWHSQTYFNISLLFMFHSCLSLAPIVCFSWFSRFEYCKRSSFGRR